MFCKPDRALSQCMQQISWPNIPPQHISTLGSESAIIVLFQMRLPKPSLCIPLPSLCTSLPNMSTHSSNSILAYALLNQHSQQSTRNPISSERTQHSQSPNIEDLIFWGCLSGWVWQDPTAYATYYFAGRSGGRGRVVVPHG